MSAAPLPARADAASDAAREVFLDAVVRVLNLRMVAAAFYFVLLLVASRAPWFYLYGTGDAFDSTLALVRFLRQNLISAYLILLTLALIQGLAAMRHWSLRTTLAAGLPLLGLAAVASMAVRVWAVDAPIKTGNLGYYFTVVGLWWFIGGLACIMFWQARADAASRRLLAQARRERDELEAQRCEAQLAALNAQIEPHFLFNTLANVKRLYETTPERGREMLVSLIEYLRAALPLMRENGSTLGRELELVGAFLSILKMRMGERLGFSIQAPPELMSARVPPLVLPTLVENAIKHGLSPLLAGGTIQIGARAENETLILWVEDDGAGFSASGGSGVGLANTRARLAALHGERAGLSLAAVSPRGVRAEVRLPLLTTHETCP